MWGPGYQRGTEGRLEYGVGEREECVAKRTRNGMRPADWKLREMEGTLGRPGESTERDLGGTWGRDPVHQFEPAEGTMARRGWGSGRDRGILVGRGLGVGRGRKGPLLFCPCRLGDLWSRFGRGA